MRSDRTTRSVTAIMLTAICALPTLAHDDDLWPTESWTEATPAEHGLDGAKLEDLAKRIDAGEQYPDLHSLLVVRSGRLVFERYFAGHSADRLHMQQSVSKSFTSAAVGIALREEILKGVDEKLLAFFPDLEGIENVDERKRAITLEDLLTMRSGTDYHERGPGSPHFQLNDLDRGWTKFYLDRPMVTDPGTKFQYDSGAVIVTSAIIEARTGKHADALIEEHLFAPLGIERSRWYRNAEGHPHTGGGLNLRSRDMAKLGLLYLRKGRWEDEQILPESWVEASLQRHVKLESRGKFAGYGYWWWVLPPDPDGAGKQDIYAACGFRAQYIFVIPEHDMVVVVTGGTRNDRDQRRPIDFLYTHILKAVAR